MRVCFLTHYFPPEVGAPQTRIELLARTLAADGAEVTVHTGFPHYPDGGVKAPYRNRPWLTSAGTASGSSAARVYPAANRGFAPRLADHTAFALSALATSRASGSRRRGRRRDAAAVHGRRRCDLRPLETGRVRGQRRRSLAGRAQSSSGRFATPERSPPRRDWSAGSTARRTSSCSPTRGIATTLAGVPDAAGKSRRAVAGRRPRAVRRSDAETPDDGAPLRVLFAGTVGLAQDSRCWWTPRGSPGPEVVQTHDSRRRRRRRPDSRG